MMKTDVGFDNTADPPGRFANRDKKMSINNTDIKLLWGRAAGSCSHPECTEDLTALVEKGSYNVGEMAHIIAREPTGPRAAGVPGPDEYANLILLCPTHHRHIDKSPEGTYTIEALLEWKRRHEESARRLGADALVHTFDALCERVQQLLGANKAVFDAYGPKSDIAKMDPSSNLSTVWELRRLDRIIPNNLKILALIDANASFVPKAARSAVESFRVHAEAYEKHIHGALDHYPLFPAKFAEAFVV